MSISRYNSESKVKNVRTSKKLQKSRFSKISLLNFL
jgi:hypothetical protein